MRLKVAFFLFLRKAGKVKVLSHTCCSPCISLADLILRLNVYDTWCKTIEGEVGAFVWVYYRNLDFLPYFMYLTTRRTS